LVARLPFRRFRSTDLRCGWGLGLRMEIVEQALDESSDDVTSDRSAPTAEDGELDRRRGGSPGRVPRHDPLRAVVVAKRETVGGEGEGAEERRRDELREERARETRLRLLHEPP